MNLLKVRTGMLTTLLVGLGVLGLAGCGGDTPTATPVAAPTATAAVMEEPTATEAAMAEPTATEAMMEEPTATTGTTSGTGSGDAADLLDKAGKAMKALKTYHLSMTIDSSAGATTAEGDFALPDSYRMTLETSGQSTEVIIVGGSSYVKVPGTDQYFESPADPSLLGAADATSFGDLAQDAQIVGDETIDGAATTHVTFKYDANAAAESTGATTGQDLGMAQTDAWIDKSTGYMRQVKVVSEAGGVSSTTTVKYSKFNETIDPPIEKPTNIMVMPDIPTVAIP